MLKGDPEVRDLPAERDRLLGETEHELQALEAELGADSIEYLPDADVVTIQYPVLEYPKTIKSHNFDKNPLVEGRLMGIKGQYLIFDTGVINIRKFGSYRVAFEAEGAA